MLPVGSCGWNQLSALERDLHGRTGPGWPLLQALHVATIFPTGCNVPQSLWSHPCSVPSQRPSVSLHCGSHHLVGEPTSPPPPMLVPATSGAHLADWRPGGTGGAGCPPLLAPGWEALLGTWAASVGASQLCHLMSPLHPQFQQNLFLAPQPSAAGC